jgi:hypothetical protein
VQYQAPCTVNSTVCCLDNVTGPAASVRHKAQHCQTHRHWSLCSSNDISWRHTDGDVKQKLAQEIFSYEKKKRLECRTSGKRRCLHWMEAGFVCFLGCLWSRYRCVWRSNSIAGRRFLEWRSCFQGSPGRFPGTAAHFLRK